MPASRLQFGLSHLIAFMGILAIALGFGMFFDVPAAAIMLVSLGTAWFIYTRIPVDGRTVWVRVASVILCLSLLFSGWRAAEWSLHEKRIDVCDHLREGMTREEVENILKAPILNERTEGSTGRIDVLYGLFHDGFVLANGCTIEAIYDPDSGKAIQISIQYADGRPTRTLRT